MKVVVSMLVAVSVAIHARQKPPVQPVTLEALRALPYDTTTLYVRNFWATWCKPCIEELPIFGKIVGKGIVVELVSVDDARDSAKVQRFWTRHGFAGVRVLHLRQKLTTREIDAIAPEWSGSLPMTILVRGSRRIVHEGQLTEPELRTLLEQLRSP